MPLITRTEYVEIDGVPLATPAWEVTSLIELFDLADTRGELVEVPYRRGALAYRRQLGPKRVNLPLNIYGAQDQDGAAHPSAREGLQINRDLLVRDVLRPPQVFTAATRLLRAHLADGSVRSGPCQVVGRLRPTEIGPGAMAAAIELALTEGGLRDETAVDVTSASVPGGGSDTLTVPNPGLDYQDAITYTLTGTATSVKLTNDTADPGGDVWLEFGGALTGGVELDTLNYLATRGGVNVVGFVTDSGHERWLPLVPGDNTITIEPTGGTATLQVEHFPFYP